MSRNYSFRICWFSLYIYWLYSGCDRWHQCQPRGFRNPAYFIVFKATFVVSLVSSHYYDVWPMHNTRFLVIYDFLTVILSRWEFGAVLSVFVLVVHFVCSNWLIIASANMLGIHYFNVCLFTHGNDFDGISCSLRCVKI